MSVKKIIVGLLNSSREDNYYKEPYTKKEIKKILKDNKEKIEEIAEEIEDIAEEMGEDLEDEELDYEETEYDWIREYLYENIPELFDV